MSVFYRFYRPQRFSDLVGQDAIARTLLAQLESGKVGHGYLFYGPRGTGKTSTARILAKAVNCQGSGSGQIGYRQDKLNTKPSRFAHKFSEPCNKCLSCLAIAGGSHLDLIEIDAASNRGIDEIRDLREKVKLSPVSGKFKVYIIDEAHMLTTEAFNALLKTLEEPPLHAIFILCTTEVGKLPATIVSRLQRFNFVRAGRENLVRIVEKIAKAEKIKINREAIEEIAQLADGSYRDAVSILDQLSTKTKTVELEDVLQIARIGGFDQITKMIEFLATQNLRHAVLFVENLGQGGGDIAYFARELVLMLEKILFIKLSIDSDVLRDLSPGQIETLRNLAQSFKTSDLENLMRILIASEADIKFYPLSQIPLVLAICKYLPQGLLQEVEVPKVQPVKQEREVWRVTKSKSAKGDGSPIRTDRHLKKRLSEISNVSKVQKSLKEPKTKEKSKRSNFKAFSTGQIEKNWEKFVSSIKPINAHVMALLRSTRPVKLEDSNLVVEVFYRFHKEKLEEPKIMRMLDDAIANIFQKDVKLKFVLAGRGAKPPKPVVKSDVIDVASSDLEMMAQEIFSK